MGAKRSAFTMIELLFVIVVLGIVGGIALEAIRNYYEGIYRSQVYTQRAADADHILDLVAKYFENAISTSIVNLDRNLIGEGTCKVPEAGDIGDDFTVAFVAVDAQGLRGGWSGSYYLPGWNEDVAVAGNTITQSGASYSYVTGGGSAIYNNSRNAPNNGPCTDFNMAGNYTTATQMLNTKYLLITGSTATTATLNKPLDDDNRKRAYVINSGYAFRVAADAQGNFWMYSGFRPWDGQRYNTAGTVRLLGRNVAHFYADYDASDFAGDPELSNRGLVWRLKVCMRGLDEDLSDSTAPSNDICREKRVHVRY